MDVHHELAVAVRRLRDTYLALAGEPLPEGVEPRADCPLGEALTTVREASSGRAMSGLLQAIEQLERLGLVPEDTAASLDVREPRGAVEVAAARAVTWERLRRGMPVASVLLARLGGVGSSAIRMAAREGRLTYTDEGRAEGDARTYVTAASAAEWLYQRQQTLARIRQNEQ